MFSLSIKSEIIPTIKAVLPLIKRITLKERTGRNWRSTEIIAHLPWWSFITFGILKDYYQDRIESLIEMWGDRSTQYIVKIA